MKLGKETVLERRSEQLEFGKLQTSKELILLVNIANASISQRVYDIAERFSYIVKVEIFLVAEWTQKHACIHKWPRARGEDITN